MPVRRASGDPGYAFCAFLFKRCVLMRYRASAVAQGRMKMPYLIGWMLGVPLIVLVILYLIFH
jgi:hypothetical protein